MDSKDGGSLRSNGRSVPDERLAADERHGLGEQLTSDRSRHAAFSYRAVLFDFDGTLVDTGPAVIAVASQALEACGYDLDAVGDLHQLIGPPLPDGFMLVANIDRKAATQLVDTYRALFNEQVKPGDYPPFPGIRELLEALKAQGTPIAVATSRLDETARAMIAELDVPPFDVIAGRLEPGRATKADCIRACLDALACDPADAVMVGDRRFDVEGAHELGLPCIGVGRDEQGRAELTEAGADAVCCDTYELAALLGIDLSARGSSL